MALKASDLTVGQVHEEEICQELSRTQIVMYAGTSGDYNPLHIDIDYARQAGMPDVFAHGMLSAAYLARVLTRWAEPAALRRLSNLRDAVGNAERGLARAEAELEALFARHGEDRVRVASGWLVRVPGTPARYVIEV